MRFDRLQPGCMLQRRASAALSSAAGWLCSFDALAGGDVTRSCCRAVGITVTVLAGMQWLTAVFWRPDRGVQLRRWWNIWHHSWGRIALALAIANIYVGLCITQPGTRYFVGQTVVFGVLFALVSHTHKVGTCISKFQQFVGVVCAPGRALQVVLKNDIEYLMKPWTPAAEEDADMKRLLTGTAEQHRQFALSATSCIISLLFMFYRWAANRDHVQCWPF